MAFAPQLVELLAKGFDAQTASLCAGLLRILFPTVFLTGLAFSMVGVLQSMGEFYIPAALSVASNGIVILYYLLFCRRFGIYGLAWAFLLGWAAQAVMQVPWLVRHGLSPPALLSPPGAEKCICADASGDGLHVDPAGESADLYTVCLLLVFRGRGQRHGVCQHPYDDYGDPCAVHHQRHVPGKSAVFPPAERRRSWGHRGGSTLRLHAVSAAAHDGGADAAGEAHCPASL